MSDNSSIKPVRVMHLVSSEGVTGAAQQWLFMPMLTRMPKARVRMLVVSLSPNVVPGPVLRQNGVPVYDVPLSKRKFSFAAFRQLSKAARSFRPDVIQAWGHTAQIVSHWLRGRCEWEPKLVWSIANTAPLPRNAGMIDRHKLKHAARLARRADRIVYSSAAGAAAHRRVGFPEEGHAIVPLGVDPTRFKPDVALRRKVREQLGLAHDAFVVGMVAPFRPEYDHATLLRAVGELIKTHPNMSVLLAGHGVQKGNASLMALVGGGTLGTRTHLLGEWSDVAALFNACDLACSSALNDDSRVSLVMAMLCGVPCVATGMGAQGEVIGHFGIAVEPGSPAAFIRGITRILQLPPEKRLAMAQGARKHALASYASIRSLQKYLQLYYDLAGRSLAAADSVPAPKVDASIPAPAPATAALEPPKPATNKAGVDMHELADPDSLEKHEPPNKAAVEQPPAGPMPAAKVPASKPEEADVLVMFESSLAQQPTKTTSPMSERARGVVEMHEDLLAPEVLQGAATTPEAAASSPVATTAPSVTAPKAEDEPARASEPAPAVAASRESQDASDESSLAETTLDLALKIDPAATTTLEIPADLIFKAADAPTSASPDAASPTPHIESTQPVSEPTEKSIRVADSSTVPALAVDALLSASDATPHDPTPQKESDAPHPSEADEGASVQLDLLADAPDTSVQQPLPFDRKVVAG